MGLSIVISSHWSDMVSTVLSLNKILIYLHQCNALSRHLLITANIKTLKDLYSKSGKVRSWWFRRRQSWREYRYLRGRPRSYDGSQSRGARRLWFRLRPQRHFGSILSMVIQQPEERDGLGSNWGYLVGSLMFMYQHRKCVRRRMQ